MAYLYTPPTWRHVGVLRRSLTFGITTCVCVYRQGGLWHQVLMAGPEVFDQAIDTDAATGTYLLFTRPTVVPDALHDELAANVLTPTDSSWSPGTLTPA